MMDAAYQARRAGAAGGDEGLTADDLLWNWARWTWSGAAVGNMAHVIHEGDDVRPINERHAQAVEALHATLPWHERMVVIAEYPQKHGRFAMQAGAARRQAARAWIFEMTGVHLSDTDYKLYLGLFKDEVGRKVR
ncbi:phage protein [plant metagenome]|uniref:Phage protein n=1 Tax=plant metagenome TaxID=1297885 RepID=A0A484UPY4_9ZZZZ